MDVNQRKILGIVCLAAATVLAVFWIEATVTAVNSIIHSGELHGNGFYVFGYWWGIWVKAGLFLLGTVLAFWAGLRCLKKISVQ
jgi:hypothetical protein